MAQNQMTSNEVTKAVLIKSTLLLLVVVLTSSDSLLAQERARLNAVAVEATEPGTTRTGASKTKLAGGSIKDDILAADRIVFLGDSNTHAGQFIVQIEATLLDTFGKAPEIINLGLGSETCCGLSEPIHPFPRPTVLERLDRVLDKTKPDIVFACYGMNDGIYHPFDEARFAAYQAGINTIIEKVNASGAKLILMTPPPFDPLPYRLAGKLVPADGDEFSWKTIYEHYDANVIKVYADWVMTQRNKVAAVVDTHTPLTDYLMEKRKTDPEFAFSNDGVHFDNNGHKAFAQSCLKAVGFDDRLSDKEKLLSHVQKRQAISHPAWLSEVGHLRPGVKAGLPIDQAEEKMKSISKDIESLLSNNQE
jgi:lysophospholipase L1-like esterase